MIYSDWQYGWSILKKMKKKLEVPLVLLFMARTHTQRVMRKICYIGTLASTPSQATFVLPLDLFHTTPIVWDTNTK